MSIGMQSNHEIKDIPSTETPLHPQAEKSESDLSNGHSTRTGRLEEEVKEEDPPVDTVFQLTVNLPHQPWKIQVMVSTQEQVQDLRQSIVEFPDTYQYSCFHLEHRKKPINDFIELSEIEGIDPNSEIDLVEDPYTEKDARVHLVRLRELLGAAGDRTDTLLGLSAGLSLHDAVTHLPTSANGSTPTLGSTATSDETSNPSLPMEDYDFEAPEALDTLMFRDLRVPPKTVKAISLSPWNPPPYQFRQRGHLLYLQVTTTEGEQYQITSSISGFFVNRCSNSKFDPSPRPPPKDHYAHSLLTLIEDLSPSFSSSFIALQEFNNRKDPLSTFQPTNTIPANPWLVSSAGAPHQPDMTRQQETYLIAGSESAETLRDWNEEFQSTRELPKETVQERVFRERLSSKLFADYNDAAARGAVLVARGEIPALNPTENRDAQIFVYNNIFFSFGADGVSTFATEGGDEAARVATGKDVAGVRAVNQLDIPGLFTPGTVVVDYLGKRIVAQSIVPGIFKQRGPEEHQIDYGGVEGKDVVAEKEEFVPAFELLSRAMKVKKHPVWDKEGKKHELEASVETKGLLGTDGRKYVLDLYRITPLDISWLEAHWRDRPEGDTQTRLKDNDPGTSYPHRMAVLRSELVDAFWRSKMRDYVTEKLKTQKSLEAGGDASNIAETSMTAHTDRVEEDAPGDQEARIQETLDGSSQSAGTHNTIDISGFNFALNPDVFTGQMPETDDEKEQWNEDEGNVRAACTFLLNKVIPSLIKDLSEGDIGFPMDGESLSRLLHKRGINIRYLGKIASLAGEQGPRLKALQALSVREMISRAFKHISNHHLRFLPPIFAGPCITHLLNCLLGTSLNPNPAPEIDEAMHSLYPSIDCGFKTVTPASLRAEMRLQVRQRYDFDLQENWHLDLNHIQLLREIALKLGLQLEFRKYSFVKEENPNSDAAVPVMNGSLKTSVTNGHSNGHAKRKGKSLAGRSPSPPKPASAQAQVTFRNEDIVNIVPIIKEASPKSILAEEAFEAGRISIAQDQKDLGQELLLESLSLHEQIYGILHPEVARVYSQMSLLYYQLGEKGAAIELARKAVIVSERTLGVDAAETVLSYLNLGLFEHANGNTMVALAYIRHALELWKIIFGKSHPDSITTINNAAVMLQHLRNYHQSRLWFEASLQISRDVFGDQSPHTATLLYQLAQALALDNDSKVAVNRMREAYTIYLSSLGPDDKNTKEAENWLEQLTQNAVSIAKHAKDVQTRKLRRAQLNPHVNLVTKPQLQVGQSASEAESGVDPRGRNGLDSRSIEELMKFIEGGGDTSARISPRKRPNRGNPKRRGRAVVGAIG